MTRAEKTAVRTMLRSLATSLDADDIRQPVDRPAPPQPWPPMRSAAPAELPPPPLEAMVRAVGASILTRTEAFAQPE
jgi:hypothetical protein